MLHRIGVLALLLTLSGYATASFELALIPDGTAKVVHRYDMDSGIYLGSFGQNRLNSVVGSIAIDQSLNTAYVVDGTVIRRFNYNTGEYTGAFDTGVNPVRDISVANDGLLIVANGLVGTGPNLYVFGNSNPLASTAHNAASLVVASVQNDNGSFTDAMNEGPNNRATGRGTWGSAPGSFLFGGGNVTAVAERGNKFVSIRASWGSLILFPSINSSGQGGSVFVPSSTPALAAGHTITGASWGHVDPFVITTSGTNSQLGWYDVAGSRVITYNLPSQIQNARDIAIVVAPEPGTMLALGAGAAALLRRRKKLAA